MRLILSKIIGVMLSAAMMLSFASCKDNGPEKQNPTVEIVPGTVTENSLSFQITPSNANAVSYCVTAASEPELSAEDVLKNGQSADATASKTYTVEDLNSNTAYRITAVASNEAGNSELAVVEMTTAEEPVAPASVSLTAGEITYNSLSFQITPSNANAVSYCVTAASEPEPSVEDVFKNGQSADATASKTYTVEGLAPTTAYRITAVASNEAGNSEPAVIEMTTVEEPVAPASVSLTAGEVTYNSLSFTVTSADASKVAYVCVVKGETIPAVEEILSSGSAVDAGQTVSCIVNDLEAETEYVIVAAACDMKGNNPVLSESLNMTTGAIPAPKVGDFYYSDGTWSTELDEAKTPIAIVFYVGEASDYNDYASSYKLKDGVADMKEIRGYAIALKDATLVDGYNESVWWSSFDSRYEATTSGRKNDFRGYTNTKSIVAVAEIRGGLTSDNSSFPATYYATKYYESVCPAPETSSGWFLPSAYQFQYIWDNVYFNTSGLMNAYLEKSFETLGDKAEPMYVRDSEYWTSSECIDDMSGCSTYAYYFCFDSSNFNPGFISDYRKNSYMRVRSVLVF